MKTFIIIIFLITNISLFCQDFEFIWIFEASLQPNLYVNIQQKHEKCFMKINFDINEDTLVKKVKKEDCNYLINFLNGYNFEIKGSTIYGQVTREYQETIILPDTNWIIINDDSIRFKYIDAWGYQFDYETQKCYTEFQECTTIADGYKYKGEF